MGRDLQEKNQALEQAQATIKVLTGLLPICVYCKKVRDDDGYWEAVETYVARRSEATFSPGICDECARAHHPDVFP